MDQEQQHFVRASFAKIAPIADTAAAMFYDRLFATDPTLRPLFKGDMVVQGRLLMTMIETAVENVHQLDQILPAVRDLGGRHAGYGVKAGRLRHGCRRTARERWSRPSARSSPRPCAMRGS
jgi:hemoglobin-like flavoprotein